MIKSELILKLRAKYSSLSLNDIEKILDLFLNNIVKGLQNSKKIELRGFGTLVKRLTKKNLFAIQGLVKKFLKKKIIKYILK